jgi:DNA-3-methyladenine glycosylase
MYLSAGHIYIFPKSNFCHLNFVCGPKDYGSAVLIRALEPSDESKPIIRRRREKQRRAAATNDRLLCNGPMNLCQALGIGGELDGKTLDDVPVELYEAPGHTEIWCGPRIGVRNDLPRRYTLADSRFISHLNEKRYTLSANLCR